MAVVSRWWRIVLLGLTLVGVSIEAPHWSLVVFFVHLLFSALPVMCWLVAAPSSLAGFGLGVGLAGLSLVPGIVFGPGGLGMFRVLPDATWVAVFYLPSTLLVVGIVAAIRILLWRRTRAPGSALPRRPTIIARSCLSIALILGCGCGFLEAYTEDGEFPEVPSAPIIGMLPSGLTVVVGPDWDGGSSVSGETYVIAGTRGQSANEIAAQLSRYVAGLTHWPLPAGFGGRCYRASGLIAYSGRFCTIIEPAPDRPGAVDLRIEGWDNRFGGFSPDPG